MKYVDCKIKTTKGNFTYQAELYREDITEFEQEHTIKCRTENLKTGEVETVKFIAGRDSLCLVRQLRKARGKISRGMLQVAYNLIMDEFTKHVS